MEKKTMKQINKSRMERINIILTEKKRLFMKYGISYRSFHNVDPIKTKTLSNPRGGQMRCEYFSKEVIDSLSEEEIMRCSVNAHDGETIIEYEINNNLWIKYDFIDSVQTRIDNCDDSCSEQLFNHALKLVETEYELKKLRNVVKQFSASLSEVNYKIAG